MHRLVRCIHTLHRFKGEYHWWISYRCRSEVKLCNISTIAGISCIFPAIYAKDRKVLKITRCFFFSSNKIVRTHIFSTLFPVWLVFVHFLSHGFFRHNTGIFHFHEHTPTPGITTTELIDSVKFIMHFDVLGASLPYFFTLILSTFGSGLFSLCNHMIWGFRFTHRIVWL